MLNDINAQFIVLKVFHTIKKTMKIKMYLQVSFWPIWVEEYFLCPTRTYRQWIIELNKIWLVWNPNSFQKFLYKIGIPHHPNLFLFYLYIIQYILKVLKFLYDFFDISWFTNYFSFEKKDFDAPHYPDSEYVVKTFDRLIFLFIFWILKSF